MSGSPDPQPDMAAAYLDSERAGFAMHKADMVLIALSEMANLGMETRGKEAPTQIFEVIDVLTDITSNLIKEAMHVNERVGQALSAAYQ